jgi:endonuclease/exonuclease/phosphatase (EEP) superfamily protein YafD
MVIVGDLNVTMWSPYYQKMMDLAPKIYNVRQGFGVTPTWPSSNFTKIPIDHCFLSRDLMAKDFKILESNGSDHLPMVVEILY